jgi:hypothetical protein
MKKIGTILFIVALVSLLYFATQSIALAGGDPPVGCCWNSPAVHSPAADDEFPDANIKNDGTSHKVAFAGLPVD